MILKKTHVSWPKPTGAWFNHHFGDNASSDIVRNPLLYSTYQRWPEIVQDVRVWHLRELFLAKDAESLCNLPQFTTC
jgi:hypothetical protein